DSGVFVVSITLFLFEEGKRYEHLSFYPSIDDPEHTRVGNMQLYSGRDYITFRPEFSDVPFSVQHDAKSVIVTMGGTDPLGLTMKVLNAIAHNSKWHITVLLSTISADYEKVEAFCNLYANITLITFANNIAELFSQHDIA